VTENNETLEEGVIRFRGVGYSLPFSFEAMEIPGGEYVPSGNKWIQKVGWAFTSALFRVYEWAGTRLSRSRHIDWSCCYECGGRLELREFERKTRFVPDGTMQTVSNLPHLHIQDLLDSPNDNDHKEVPNDY
jgi:hypothetical protein